MTTDETTQLEQIGTKLIDIQADIMDLETRITALEIDVGLKEEVK